MQIQYPVFVRAIDDGNVRMISSDLQSLWNYFEEIDVESGEYEAWDACARPVKLTWDRQKGARPLLLSSETEQAKLANALTEYAYKCTERLSIQTELLLQDDNYEKYYQDIELELKKKSLIGRVLGSIRRLFCSQM